MFGRRFPEHYGLLLLLLHSDSFSPKCLNLPHLMELQLPGMKLSSGFCLSLSLVLLLLAKNL